MLILIWLKTPLYRIEIIFFRPIFNISCDSFPTDSILKGTDIEQLLLPDRKEMKASCAKPTYIAAVRLRRSR